MTLAFAFLVTVGGVTSAATPDVALASALALVLLSSMMDFDDFSTVLVGVLLLRSLFVFPTTAKFFLGRGGMVGTMVVGWNGIAMSTTNVVGGKKISFPSPMNDYRICLLEFLAGNYIYPSTTDLNTYIKE